MSPIFDLFRRHTKTVAIQEKLLADYRVGIVVSNQGLNEKQLAELSVRLDFIARMTEKEGTIHLFVPGFNMADAEESVPREVRNLLERKKKCQLLYIPTRGDHKDGVAEHIHYALVAEHRCDEIWCCPAMGQTKNSPARVAQVYRLGTGPGQRNHHRFKMIPPWVEPPTPQSKAPAKKPNQKGAQPWLKHKSRFR